MRYILLLLLFSLGLTSCTQTAQSTPLPTPVSIFLAYPSYLQPTANLVRECASTEPSLALFIEPVPITSTGLPGPLVKLYLGDFGVDSDHVYPIGTEQIKIIVNAGNPISDITPHQLLSIFSGQQMDWEFATHTSIQVWTYPEEDHLRALFEAALPGNPHLTSIANIAPDPLALINSIASDPGAIGYCPDSWLQDVDADWFDQIKTITITPALTGNLTHPLLASVSESPSIGLQRLFNCLQNIEH